MYRKVSTIKISNDRKILLSIKSPACVKSVTPISEIIPVVRKINMNWLDNDGNILIIVCGNIIFLKTIFLFRFKAEAASICPLGVDSYPLLNISAKYPEKLIVKANKA